MFSFWVFGIWLFLAKNKYLMYFLSCYVFQRQHRFVIHTDRPPVPCETCGKKVRTVSHLRAHNEQHHGLNKKAKAESDAESSKRAKPGPKSRKRKIVSEEVLELKVEAETEPKEEEEEENGAVKSTTTKLLECAHPEVK